jgi:hypothetical protein
VLKSFTVTSQDDSIVRAKRNKYFMFRAKKEKKKKKASKEGGSL